MLQRRGSINWLADFYCLCVHTGIIITLSIVSPNMPSLKYGKSHMLNGILHVYWPIMQGRYLASSLKNWKTGKINWKKRKNCHESRCGAYFVTLRNYWDIFSPNLPFTLIIYWFTHYFIINRGLNFLIF